MVGAAESPNGGDPPREVRAVDVHALVLRDGNERPRMVLTGGDEASGPAVVMLDRAGNARLNIQLRDAAGGNPELAMCGPGGVPRVELTIMGAGTNRFAGLVLRGAGGAAVTVKAGLTRPSLALHDGEGQTRVVVSLDDDGEPIVGVLDADGEPARTVTFHLAGDQESSQEKP